MLLARVQNLLSSEALQLWRDQRKPFEACAAGLCASTYEQAGFQRRISFNVAYSWDIQLRRVDWRYQLTRDSADWIAARISLSAVLSTGGPIYPRS